MRFLYHDGESTLQTERSKPFQVCWVGQQGICADISDHKNTIFDPIELKIHYFLGHHDEIVVPAVMTFMV